MWSSEATRAHVSGATSHRANAFRLLVATQGFFFFFLAWCVLLEHNFNAQSAGISFYGVTHRTVVLAILGYAIAAVGLWRVAAVFRDGGLGPHLWVGLRAVATMLILLLLTPYDAGTFFNWAHMSVGVVGALVQLAISIALVNKVRSPSAITGLSVQLIGGVLGAFSLPDWRFQYLLYAETIFELGFGWCLLEWTKVLPRGVSEG